MKWTIMVLATLLLAMPTMADNIAPEATAMGSPCYAGVYPASGLNDQVIDWNMNVAYMSDEGGYWFALNWSENKTFDEIRLFNIGYAKPQFASLNLYDFDLKVNTNLLSTDINDAVWQTLDEVRGGAPDLYTYTSASPLTSNAILVYVITPSSSPSEPYIRVLEMEVESAIPEPMTMSMLGVGGLGVLLRRRKK